MSFFLFLDGPSFPSPLLTSVDVVSMILPHQWTSSIPRLDALSEGSANEDYPPQRLGHELNNEDEEDKKFASSGVPSLPSIEGKH